MFQVVAARLYGATISSRTFAAAGSTARLVSLPAQFEDDVLAVTFSRFEADSSRFEVQLDPTVQTPSGHRYKDLRIEDRLDGPITLYAASKKGYPALLAATHQMSIERVDSGTLDAQTFVNLTGLAVQWSTLVNLTNITLLVNGAPVAASSLTLSALGSNLFCVQLHTQNNVSAGSIWSSIDCTLNSLTAAGADAVSVSCSCTVASSPTLLSATSSVAGWAASPPMIPNPPEDPDPPNGNDPSPSRSALALTAWIGIGVGAGVGSTLMGVLAYRRIRRRRKRLLDKSSSEVTLVHVNTFSASAASLDLSGLSNKPGTSTEDQASTMPKSPSPATDVPVVAQTASSDISNTDHKSLETCQCPPRVVTEVTITCPVHSGSVHLTERIYAALSPASPAADS